MCTNPDRFWNMKQYNFSLPYLQKRIERFYNGKKEFLDDYRDSFSISGGEPTLSSHFIPIIKKINALFPRIKIICLTNGRLFAYKEYAKEFLQLDGNLELAISIHGHNAEIYDKITQTSGSFLQTMKGIKNILCFRKQTQFIEIRVVIHRLNYKFLEEITKFIMYKFPQIVRLVFIFFEIEGKVIKNLRILKLTYTQLLPYISKIYDLISYFPEVRFYHFPLCALPPKFFPYIWRTLPKFEVAFLSSCKMCNLKAFCLGIHKGYLKYINTSEFHPIKDNFDIKKGANWHHPILSINL
jgi:MoaA/NifB/PqqE/SkfB family radical SAM enzyme